MPSEITSGGTKLVASQKVQDFPEGMTLSVRSPGFGVDEEAPLEEAKLPE
jgi:hypothetical protein